MQEDSSSAPIVLLYPGAFGGKSDYSMIAQQIASAGYIVMVLEQLRSIPPEFSSFFSNFTEGNLLEASVTEVALRWFREEGAWVFNMDSSPGGYGGSEVSGCPSPDSNSVLLFGHSLGANVV
jgi:hypothetical protein